MSCGGVWVRVCWVVLLGVVLAPQALAGGPRFVTGTQYSGVGAGQIMAFYTASPLYYTDPGELSATVSHAQSDAMVAAAAGVWNVPIASLTLAQGGTLAEHVSSANSYIDGTGIVFPADVQATNYLAKPIAVVYDTDGSMTDMLLGAGASEPSECRTNAVTESVDGFGQTGTIEHAVILLNGLCVGSTPQQLLQMQYQLERVFGRVLGLAWSQCNDNVFTVATPVNSGQAMNWPMMHPIDVVCGLYTYQCMQEPFTLRPDDLSTLALLYPVTAANVVAGKTISLTNAISVSAWYEFPSTQGMEDVNVTAVRTFATLPLENYELVSGVTGAMYQRNGGNPVSGMVVSNADNVGSAGEEEVFAIGSIPLDYSQGAVNQLFFQGESINPLYSGEYAVGTYEGTPVSMSGPGQSIWAWLPNGGFQWGFVLVSSDEAAGCSPGSDGSEGAPVAVDASGWWTNVLCGSGHVAWRTASVKAGRSWTLETTALDETGAATLSKMRPVMGVWSVSDAMGTLPTVASAATAMNSLSVGMTQLGVGATKQDATVRFAIADEYGAGRPDFSYTARMLYADSVAPATVGAGGGRITITGMGFRLGNEVLVNGVSATVVSWSTTQIVASAPTMVASGMSVGAAANVEVFDPGTGGQTVMRKVLVYTAAADTIAVVSAPAALDTGVVAATPFAVRVFASDGVTAVAGASVQFAVTGGAALSCVGACVGTTDATGLASVMVTGTAVGAVTLSAREMSGGATVSLTLMDAAPVRAVVVGPVSYVAAGAAVGWSVSLTATQDGVAVAGAAVMWTGGTGLGVGASQGVTDGSGDASIAVQTTGLPGGTSGMVMGCVWSTVCASVAAYGVDASLWRVGVQSGLGQSVLYTAELAPVVLVVTDVAGHPLLGAAVTVYQTVDAWEGVCAGQGRCAAAPVIASSQSAGVSDASGLVVVTPLQVAGVAEVVNVAAVTGTQGFVGVVLEKVP